MDFLSSGLPAVHEKSPEGEIEQEGNSYNNLFFFTFARNYLFPCLILENLWRLYPEISLRQLIERHVM